MAGTESLQPWRQRLTPSTIDVEPLTSRSAPGPSLPQLSDVSGFAVAALAAYWAKRRSQSHFSYGYHRMEVGSPVPPPLLTLLPLLPPYSWPALL